MNPAFVWFKKIPHHDEIRAGGQFKLILNNFWISAKNEIKTIMKKNLFRYDEQYFHMNVEFEVHPLPLLKQLDWIRVQKKLQPLLSRYHIELHALLMMDTHLHLLIRSEKKQENYFCEELKAGLKTTAFEAESYCEPILSYAQYVNAYKYIYRNPVEARLCDCVEKYPYSSLQGLLGRGVSYCQVADHLGLIQHPVQRLHWLNDEDRFNLHPQSDLFSS